MPSTFNVQFVLSGDVAAAQSALRSALEAEGFSIKEEHDGAWKAVHGSLAATMFLGVFANKDAQREVFIVKFADQGGTVQVDLHRPLIQAGAGDEDGIEAVRLYDAYQTVEASLRDRLKAAGALVSSSN